MLKLYDIKKDYKMPDYVVHALNGISINFRKNELVSILGPSGCGKTTLLNIIGGLDQYTSGDIIVGDISTKNYKDRDWDIYRNHYIGFVFQSYNLIPHLNVLQNVEMGLSISGISRSKRRAMAIAALEKVGLGEQLKKKPAQMSGGQCQRVAIARAIVTNPKIILADEPTGALDTETSKQIMDLLQEISDDRLVIMVTHNPQLAQRYSTRIIELLDGGIISDSNPYDGMPTMIEPVKPIQKEEPVVTKKERLVFGMPVSEYKKLTLAQQANVRKEFYKERRDARKNKNIEVPVEDKPDTQLVEPETSKYISRITPTAPKLPNAKKPKEKKNRASMSIFTAMMLSARNLWTKKFRTGLIAFAGSIGIIGIALVLSLTNGFNIYVENLQTSTLVNMPVTISSMAISIDTSSIIDNFNNTDNMYPDDNEVRPYSIKNAVGIDISVNILSPEYIEYVEKLDSKYYNSIRYSYSFRPTLAVKNYRGDISKVNLYGNSAGNYWGELLDKDFMQTQYDVLYGRYPQNYDEIVLVVDAYNNINASTLEMLGYQLTYKDDDSNTYANIPFSEFVYNAETNPKVYTIITNNNRYYTEDVDGKELYLEHKIKDSYEKPGNIPLKIVGVIRQNRDLILPFMPSGLAYTPELAEYYLNNCMQSDVAVAQRANEDWSVLTGNDFASDYSTLVTIMTSYGLSEKSLISTLKAMLNKETLMQYLKDYCTEEQIDQLLADMANEETVNGMMTLISKDLNIAPSILKVFISTMLGSIPELGLSSDAILTILNSGYETALQRLGASTMPSAVYIYPKSFDDKDAVLAYLDAWNDKCDAKGDLILRVKYTDMAGTVSTMLRYIITIVSGILIAFAAISLVVSSIMIAIVTYISVLERTTEIGVLRSLGARKIDIANVFNSETTIIGAISGVLGVVIAWILDFPMNAILHSISNTVPVNFAQICWWHGILLVVLSMILNIIAGFIPSIIASKKDPVVALRSTN